jgi:hypothetical protein
MTIIAAIVLLILGGALGMALANFMRTQRLKDRFGDEYVRTMDKAGDKREAEDELDGRLERAQALKIRSLTAKEVNRFVLEWQAVQADFVDQPRTAVQKANNLIREVMSTRGYPVDDFEQRAADISVDHPDLVEDYRQLHAIAKKDEKQKVSTEEMRQAMVHGRDLFDSLVQPDGKEEQEPQKEST